MGPQVVHLWFSTIRFLDRHAASDTQYLSVLHRSGKREIIRGPAVLFENPVLHESIEVKDAIQLKKASEALVVYTEVSVGTPVETSSTVDAKAGLGAEQKDEEAEDAAATGSAGGSVQLLRTSYAAGYDPAHEKSVSRRIITGPALWVPKVGEWVHEFEWSGAEQARIAEQANYYKPSNSKLSAKSSPSTGGASSKLSSMSTSTGGTTVVPGALVFNVLETNSQNWSPDASMRTSDNIPFTVQLTFNYKLKSVEHMLETSTDPVAEWWSGLEADMCVLGDHVTSTAVLEKGLNAVMSTLSSFPCLRERMESNGFSLDSVILRRVLASEALDRRFRDAAAEEADGARRLALAEVALKAERLAAQSKAEKETREFEAREREAEAREKREARAAELKEASLRLDMDRVESRRQKEHEMESAQLAHELELKSTKEQSEALQADAQMSRQIKFLRELKELDVDLTTFLMNQQQQGQNGGEDGAGRGGAAELTTLVRPQTFTFSLADATGAAVPPPVPAPPVAGKR